MAELLFGTGGIPLLAAKPKNPYQRYQAYCRSGFGMHGTGICLWSPHG